MGVRGRMNVTCSWAWLGIVARNIHAIDEPATSKKSAALFTVAYLSGCAGAKPPAMPY